ncbi:MAG: YhgE/Pip family protein [Nocardioidaceae bacterium]
MTSLRMAVSEILRISTGKLPKLAIANPVAIHNVSQATADNYGAGLAPFFMSLAAWIGGYVLFLLVRPAVDPGDGGVASSAAGRAGRLVHANAAVRRTNGRAVSGDLAGLGLTVVHVLATVGFLIRISACSIAMVHTLTAWLGAPGEFLGLVLMVLQLVSAGGAFPWQTLPGPLQAMHHVFPMSYSIDGLRHLMYGGDLTVLTLDTGVLAAYLIGSLALSRSRLDVSECGRRLGSSPSSSCNSDCAARRLPVPVGARTATVGRDRFRPRRKRP